MVRSLLLSVVVVVVALLTTPCNAQDDQGTLLRGVHALLSHQDQEIRLSVGGISWILDFGVVSHYEHMPPVTGPSTPLMVTLVQNNTQLLTADLLPLSSVARATMIVYRVPNGEVRVLLVEDDARDSDVVQNLDVNAAAVRFVDCSPSPPPANISVSARSTWCENCLSQEILTLPPPFWVDPPRPIGVNHEPQFVSFGVVAWAIEITFSPLAPSKVPPHSTSLPLGYRGAYTLIYLGEGQGEGEEATTILITNIAPEVSWIPLVVALACVVGVVALISLSLLLYRRKCMDYEPMVDAELGEGGAAAPLESASLLGGGGGGGAAGVSVQMLAKKKKARMNSLDTFRGMCLAVMIFVNYGGGGYWFFDHSYWNGLTVADLVFPWFTFIMGVSMTFSLHGLLKRESKFSIIRKVVRRALLLFLIGLFLNNGFDLSHWRIPGVLQYFAFSYLCCSLVIVLVPTGEERGWIFDDLVPYLAQWAVILVFPIINTAVTFGLDVPGCGKGYLGPGGIADGGQYSADCVGGASTAVDKWIFGENHFYQGPTCREFYGCGAHDPEGLLGAFNAVLLCWLGVHTGRVLLHYKRHVSRIAKMLVAAVILGAMGCGLCGAKRDGGVIPVNKNLWSLSFIFVLGCGANLMLILCYFIVDIRRLWGGNPFRAIGMNSIVIYIGHELLEDYFPFHFSCPVGHGWQLFENLVGVSTWLLIAYILFYNKVFFNL